MKYLLIFSFLFIVIHCKKQQTEEVVNETPETENTELETPQEEFESLDFTELQSKLDASENISAKEAMSLFYTVEEANEGNESITLEDTKLENGNTVVTLIHDNMLDDSVKGEKYVLEIKEQNGKWFVVSLKKNWHCWEGRGHTTWGIERCN